MPGSYGRLERRRNARAFQSSTPGTTRQWRLATLLSKASPFTHTSSRCCCAPPNDPALIAPFLLAGTTRARGAVVVYVPARACQRVEYAHSLRGHSRDINDDENCHWTRRDGARNAPSRPRGIKPREYGQYTRAQQTRAHTEQLNVKEGSGKEREGVYRANVCSLRRLGGKRKRRTQNRKSAQTSILNLNPP